MHPERPTPDFVTVQAAAEEIGRPAWLLYRAVKRGHLKSYHLGNSRILVRISDIETLLQASAQGGAHG